MRESCRILYRGGQGELTEKKSRFIANTRPVESEEEAIAFIEEMRKKYWDARHNCSAYVSAPRDSCSAAAMTGSRPRQQDVPCWMFFLEKRSATSV